MFPALTGSFPACAGRAAHATTYFRKVKQITALARNYFRSPREAMRAEKMPTGSPVAIQMGASTEQLPAMPSCFLSCHKSGGDRLKKKLVQLFCLMHINVLKESSALFIQEPAGSPSSSREPSLGPSEASGEIPPYSEGFPLQHPPQAGGQTLGGCFLA